MQKLLQLLQFLLILVVTLLHGCGQKRQPSETVLVTPDYTQSVTILIDMSGSMAAQMSNGKAYEFLLTVVDRMYRDRLGESDQLIVGQLSAERKAPLWQGTPQQFRQEFRSAAAFKEFLMSKSNPNGSPVYDAIAQCVEYVVSDPRVKSKEARAAVLVLSDLIDNDPDTMKARKRMVAALRELGQCNGTLGLYFVETNLVHIWEKGIRECGIKHFVVSADIVGKPQIPDFD